MKRDLSPGWTWCCYVLACSLAACSSGSPASSGADAGGSGSFAIAGAAPVTREPAPSAGASESGRGAAGAAVIETAGRAHAMKPDPTPAAGSGGASGASLPAAGAAGSGQAGATAPLPTFAIGADISWVQQDEMRGATYSDGTRKEILQLLSEHGFNYIRLRTFVDPQAVDGYDKANGYGDLAHTIAFGQRVKRAGLGLLVDFHYSDNWADPGKQCVPVAWQDLADIDALAGALHEYTQNALQQLIAAGARPDMVQIGNEITPGMLLHRCDADGQPTGSHAVSGRSSDWKSLGKLLQAGASAVRAVDPAIEIMLHIDRCDDFATSRDFIDHAREQGVEFQLFGESCYTAYQGQPSAWRSTFAQLTARYPDLQFVIAEYGPEQRAANDVMFELPDRRGRGTFNWEPTHAGAWNEGHVLFDAAGDAYTATKDLSLYDAMRTAYAERL